jgi:hypothetical protein
VRWFAHACVRACLRSMRLSIPKFRFKILSSKLICEINLVSLRERKEFIDNQQVTDTV